MKPLFILTSLASGLLFAQPGPASPLFLCMDANSDGVIDAGEIANAPTTLKKLDKNGDGKIIREEIWANRPGAPPAGGMRGPGKIMDLNGDGAFDADEISKASTSIKKLDKNGDGKITLDEFGPAPAAK